jgi:uncharacterized protein (DUF427 family)
MKATWNGATIAESDDIVTVEGNAYFPATAVVPGVLKPSTHTSVCPWKGTAHYYSLDAGGAVNENAVWYYPDPKAAAAEIKDRVAFWKGVKVS